jgi:hypothetical protein
MTVVDEFKAQNAPKITTPGSPDHLAKSMDARSMELNQIIDDLEYKLNEARRERRMVLAALESYNQDVPESRPTNGQFVC